jgi:hypothetical protein
MKKRQELDTCTFESCLTPFNFDLTKLQRGIGQRRGVLPEAFQRRSTLSG